MLKNRIITATLLISLVVFLIFFANTLIQAAVLLLIALCAGYEWLRLISATTAQKILFYDVLIFCAIVFYYMTSLSSFVLWISLIAWLIAFGVIVFYQQHQVYFPKNKWVNTGIGLLLIVPMWVGLFALLKINPLLMLFLLITVWSADIFAFFAGRCFGRHLLIERVSPAKTWEGVIGALVGTGIVAYICIRLFFPEMPVLPLLLLSLLMVPISIIGDLFESMIKRIYGVKDSGQLLPGHGGVLDRLDSLTAAAPIFVCLYFFFIA